MTQHMSLRSFSSPRQKGDAVSIRVSLSEDTVDSYLLDHIRLIANDLTFTFEIDEQRNEFLEVQGPLENRGMSITLRSIKDDFLRNLLLKQTGPQQDLT